MERNEIKLALIDIIAAEAGLSKGLDCNANLMQLGIQSISLMKIQVEIAKRFAVKIKFREFMQNNSINKLSEYLTGKIRTIGGENGEK